MKLQFLGAHNTESRTSRLTSLLVDDILVIDAGGLTSSLSFTAQYKIKAILLTHQHFDHIRDIPTIAMNFYLRDGAKLKVYSIATVREALSNHFLNNKEYPDFLKRPDAEPTIIFTKVEPLQTLEIEGYRVTPVSVNHSVPAVGYEVTAPDNKRLFYTGDTGVGLSECWQHVSPQMIVIEVTAPNKYEDFAIQSHHLTPGLLKKELEDFRRIKGYLPQVVLTHMNPRQETEIAGETAAVAGALGCSITLAHEGMRLNF